MKHVSAEKADLVLAPGATSAEQPGLTIVTERLCDIHRDDTLLFPSNVYAASTIACRSCVIDLSAVYAAMASDPRFSITPRIQYL